MNRYSYCPKCNYVLGDKALCCQKCGYLTSCLRNGAACEYLLMNTKTADVICGYYLDETEED